MSPITTKPWFSDSTLAMAAELNASIAQHNAPPIDAGQVIDPLTSDIDELARLPCVRLRQQIERLRTEVDINQDIITFAGHCENDRHIAELAAESALVTARSEIEKGLIELGFSEIIAKRDGFGRSGLDSMIRASSLIVPLDKAHEELRAEIGTVSQWSRDAKQSIEKATAKLTEILNGASKPAPIREEAFSFGAGVCY
ncbi:MAG: hypothetical protein WCJ35_06340 [Planctomycetota bacterium]